MPEEMPVGGIVQQLLGNTDDGGALATASELVGLSLAQREADVRIPSDVDQDSGVMPIKIPSDADQGFQSKPIKIPN